MATEPFTKQMRKATREAHAISDALVNAKILIAISDSDIWAEGLLIFYEVFRYLEKIARDHRNENIGKLLTGPFWRTDAFETDLEYYLGPDWKRNYVVRDEVAEYLAHLVTLRVEDMDFLMAYIYHLYMGLLSGGQILKKKMTIKSKFISSPEVEEGYAVVTFFDEIGELKQTMRSNMDLIAETLTEEKRNRLLVESKLVFEYNNKIIRTVQGTNRVLYEKIIHVMLFIMLLICYYSIFLG